MTDPYPTPLVAAVQRGDPLWPLPQSSLPMGLRELALRKRLLLLIPRYSPVRWAIDPDEFMIMPQPVRVNVDDWTAQYQVGPVPPDLQDVTLEATLSRLMADLSDQLLDHRRVALDCARVKVEPTPAGGRMVSARVPTVEAISGQTVEVLQEERRSPGLLPGYHVVVEDPGLDEGLVVADSWMRTLTVGARPLSWAHRTALETIRKGLADVLAWLGEPEGTPMHHEIMWAVRTGKGPGWPAVERALACGSSARPRYGRA